MSDSQHPGARRGPSPGLPGRDPRCPPTGRGPQPPAEGLEQDADGSQTRGRSRRKCGSEVPCARLCVGLRFPIDGTARRDSARGPGAGVVLGELRGQVPAEGKALFGFPSRAAVSHSTVLLLATQWSVEGEEGAARGQRQQERAWQLRAQDEGEGGQSLEQLEQKPLSPKPSEGPELDEDEGFGDWSQKPEQRRQHCGAGETTDSEALPRGESPEGGQEEDRPRQHTFESQGDDELTPAGVCLEELRLSPDSEPQEGPGTEDTEPKGPEGPVQGSPGLAETKEADDEQHQRCQQRRTPSPLVLEGTDPGSPPLSPSTKLSDRTESLHRSIQKSNSMKSQPALPISTIEERLEQYTQAIETSGRTPKLARQPSIELPSMAVASTKSRWETGEVQAQSSAKSPACKDIVAGDLSKRNLWEQKGGPKASLTLKNTPSAKRYKFVATGHGKYEKVLVDEGSAP
ncbi:PREDICTED: lymphocyte-specific protein 1 [Lipotes vexillifer]|uniref:Lymphocyte-specific protein 1 n=1 Tax=Lipotes vexillifer TaxID=118797 RepID=A0A340XXI9_LIPVE|nr:PREDICTED: lymphocyte-specific protein 1 [Lipotes vexillifer]